MSRQDALLERFLRYVAVPTQSDPKAKVVPSNPNEFKLAELLAEELRALGLVDIEISQYAVLTAKLPGNLPEGRKAPVIGWMAHMDTVNTGLSPEIHPRVVKNYQGGDICLNKEKDIWLRTAEHPEIERYIGDDIVVSDGTSVLGADDKSAIANVMTALSIVVEENRPHGDIYVAFVPDEELGEKGARKTDLKKFPVDFAYTIDCCELGEVVWETFNAGNAKLTVKGVTAHPMASKGVLVNPILVVHDFINMLDRGETPEYTEGREGFIVLKTLEANPSTAVLTMKIRDHNKKLYEAKKAKLVAAAEYLRVSARSSPEGENRDRTLGLLRQHRRRRARRQPNGNRLPLQGPGNGRRRGEDDGDAGRHGRFLSLRCRASHAQLLHGGSQLPQQLRIPSDEVLGKEP